ncbi:unnamed protein product (macronuclear) [Paramecium tetraurelia]|uniref:Tr-type G domain-containing protein n=1 Tax=Paramecium tetraurelia TaxID=5888 RepID=A0BTU2_PARTE|nr:uncharacterized protein GSPATT00032191001 [Paramecium tetraurelia]CAK61959.1 unnamed protein product [Paramecium tetraurelia]|eukprot:XP_001429357.1 hypothetical protein (macronuclear) [Paramecium tetraurelia strain d4-2]
MEQSLFISQQEIEIVNKLNTININVGVLGHIDSGKTSLVKTLSKITSTASLDKNPQSQERGITLDLGFSAFYTRNPNEQGKYFQFTLVDCPGHASLIKTIIGGAQIIDMMFLVIDVTKGIQTQTAECLVIGEILADKLIVVLNKIDLATEEVINKQKKIIANVLSKTKFGNQVPLVPVSAIQALGIEDLLGILLQNITVPNRQAQLNKGLLFMIDHCFQIKGQGTVTTGTIIQGSMKPNDEVYFPMLNLNKKIKSLQMFKKPVQIGEPGDRIAALFTNLDAKEIERGIVCQPGIVSLLENIVIDFKKISYYKGQLKSQNKFHITSGHLTVMGQLKLIIRPKNLQLEINSEGEYLEDYEDYVKLQEKYNLFGVLQLEKPLIASMNSLVIASKLDTDLEANICRIAFYGNILYSYTTQQLFQQNFLRIFRKKTKNGKVEKVIDNYTLLIKDLFKKETNIANYIGKLIVIKQGNIQGKIDSAFGKSGKVKVFVESGTNQDMANSDVVMIYKKYLFHK